MKERLQKVIAASYGVSRRAAEQLIIEEKVTINGRVAHIGESADPKTDKIEIKGKRLANVPKPVYIILNKPRGYVTTMADERGRKTVKELMTKLNCRVFPVGRLDMDSEGLLLMTNDGEWANYIAHPSHMVDKTYLVTVSGDAETAVKKMSRGMNILDENGEVEFVASPARAVVAKSFEDGAQISVTITEGHNRQIRKMCEQCDLKVRRLVRISIGGIGLSGLAIGKWRFMTDEEKRMITGKRPTEKKNDEKERRSNNG